MPIEKKITCNRSRRTPTAPLVCGCEFFSLFVRDDGKGIDAVLPPETGYRGLSGLRAREERMGGGVGACATRL